MMREYVQSFRQAKIVEYACLWTSLANLSIEFLFGFVVAAVIPSTEDERFLFVFFVLDLVPLFFFFGEAAAREE